jgi:hypothetical protein
MTSASKKRATENPIFDERIEAYEKLQAKIGSNSG